MKLYLIAVMAITLATPVAARTVTVTGQAGGTAVSTGTCHRIAGQLQCDSHIVATGANGRSAQADRTTTFAPGLITRQVTGVTGAGRSFGRTTTIRR